MDERKLDRRSFVRGSFVLGLSAATAALAGCASSESSSETPVSGGAATEAEVPSETDAPETSSAGAGFNLENSTPGAVKVYATTDLSADGLLRVYGALGWQPTGNVGVKLHMGEDGNPYYLQPSLLQPLVESVNGTFVDSTVLYGRRSTADGYAALAGEHGFTYAPVDILDRDGGTTLPVSGGAHLQEAEVGSHFSDYQSMISVAHFKGHGMAGFGGTFKNIAIGLATVAGKMSVHTSSFQTGAPFVERVAEFAKGVLDAMGPNVVFINVLNNLSVDCDCDGSPEAPAMADIGIMASLDPVALDQASVDQIYLSADPGKQAIIDRIESREGTHLLDYAEELGLGSKAYELVLLD